MIVFYNLWVKSNFTSSKSKFGAVLIKQIF